MKWLLAGLVVGLGISYGVMHAQALPQYLIYGRTTTGVNVPLLVGADGTLHIS